MNDKSAPPLDDEDDTIDPLASGDGEEDLSSLLPKDDIPEGDEFDESDLARLTDEERAALEDDQDEGEDGEEGQTETDEKTPPAVTEADESEPPITSAPPDAPVLPPRPEVDVEAAQTIIDEAKAAREKAFERYEDGEVTREEYLKEQQDIADREAAAKADLKLVEVYEKAVEDAATAQFDAYRDSFNRAATTYLTEHPGLIDEAHVNAYDQHVKDILGNEALRAKLDQRQILELAHKRYLVEAEALGIKAPPLEKVTPAPDPQADPKAAKPKAPPPPSEKPPLPVTIQTMPSAGLSNTRDTRFGQLQDLLEKADAVEAERIMASLTPEERDHFASLDI